MKKKSNIVILIIVVILTCCVGGFVVFNFLSKKDNKETTSSEVTEKITEESTAESYYNEFETAKNMYTSAEVTKLFSDEILKVSHKTLPLNQEVRVLGQDETNGYYKVMVDGTEYFVKASDLNDKKTKVPTEATTEAVTEATTEAATEATTATAKPAATTAAPKTPKPAATTAAATTAAPAVDVGPEPAYGTVVYSDPGNVWLWTFIGGDCIWRNIPGTGWGWSLNVMTNQATYDATLPYYTYPSLPAVTGTEVEGQMANSFSFYIYLGEGRNPNSY